MAWFNEKLVHVNRVTFRRFCMLAEEMYFLNNNEELDDLECRDEAESLIQRVLDEYIRQHFEESTRAVVQLSADRQPQYRMPK